MEPSGRKRWQPLANWRGAEDGSNRPIGNRWQPHGNDPGAHGKEVVNGSSPLEGFANTLQKPSFGISACSGTRGSGALP
jgi:hypothetical protein